MLILASRHGDAWLRYESIQHLPIVSIDFRLCEAGYGDHALFLCGGQWVPEDEAPEDIGEAIAAEQRPHNGTG